MPNYSSIYLELQALWREQQSVNAAIGGVKGDQTTATGHYAHAQGFRTTASGDYSHAEGYVTIAYGGFSHAEGLYTIASASNQHVQGRWNQTSSTALMLVGNGGFFSGRSNILEVYSDSVNVKGQLTASSIAIENMYGNMIIAGDIQMQPNYGIRFDGNGSSNGTSTTLGDYEEGDWTLTANGTSFAISGSIGKYTKIGRIMHVWGGFKCTNFGDKSNYITGLPAIVATPPTSDIITGGSTPVLFSHLLGTNARPDTASGFLFYDTMALYVPTLVPGAFYAFSCTYITNY